MEFKCIEMSKLKTDKKYIIQIYIDRHYETMDGFYLSSFECWNMYVCFNIKNKIYNFDETTYFYEADLKKNIIQNAMELRAINKVLKRLIDDSFNY